MCLTSGDDQMLARGVLQHLINSVSVSIILFPKARYEDIKLINSLLLSVMYKTTVTFFNTLRSQPVNYTFLKLFSI